MQAKDIKYKENLNYKEQKPEQITYSRMKYNDGQYEGDVLNNIPNGKGIFTDHDGGVYKGTWKNGVLDGPCTYKGKYSFF